MEPLPTILSCELWHHWQLTWLPVALALKCMILGWNAKQIGFDEHLWWLDYCQLKLPRKLIIDLPLTSSKVDIVSRLMVKCSGGIWFVCRFISLWSGLKTCSLKGWYHLYSMLRRKPKQSYSMQTTAGPDLPPFGLNIPFLMCTFVPFLT